MPASKTGRITHFNVLLVSRKRKYNRKKNATARYPIVEKVDNNATRKITTLVVTFRNNIISKATPIVR